MVIGAPQEGGWFPSSMGKSIISSSPNRSFFCSFVRDEMLEEWDETLPVSLIFKEFIMMLSIAREWTMLIFMR